MSPWRPIPSAPGYEATSAGRVRSWRSRWPSDTPRELRGKVINGSRCFTLRIDGRDVTRTARRLAKEAFGETTADA